MRNHFGLLLVTLATSSFAADWHVATLGAAQGDGSEARPWDLATALAHPPSVKPGDTIWLHAGTYRGGFEARLAGEPSRPIVVRGRPGERVTIDTRARDDKDHASIFIHGADAVFRDFEVTCSDPRRVTEIAGSWPADIRRGSIDVRGSRISLVNLVIHDLAVGVGFWSEGEGGEISGCLIYNNGWQGPDRAHGHGIYTQNARGTKRIADNVIFHQFAYGIHAYGSEKASLDGFDIEGNICFHNGCLSRGGDRSPGIMVGGGCPARRIAIRQNVVAGGNIRLGYPWGTTNDDVIVTGNYADGGLVLRDFRRATVTKNTLIAASNVVQLESAGQLDLANHHWEGNDYFVTEGRWGEASIVENGKSRGLSLDAWRRETKLDATSRFTKGAPGQLRVIVRPHQHERGRAHVAVINPAGLAEVDLDLSKVLAAGQKYRLVSVKDFFGPPFAAGAYEGKPVRIALKPVNGPDPVGLPAAKLPVTEPHFAAFVVLPNPSNEPKPACPPSPVIQSIEWADASTIVRQARDGDNWPLTWADDDALYTTWGDGTGFEPKVPRKLSCGFARVTGGPEDFKGGNIRSDAEQFGDGRRGKKGWGMLSVAGTLYLWLGHADNRGATAQLAWSRDHARNWEFADWQFAEFGLVGFVNFGRDYAGARDDFVYAYSHDGPRADTPADRFVLMRVPKDRVTERAAWEFLEKVAEGGEPVWTADIAQRGAVFSNKDACLRSAITYCPGLKRYLWWQQIPQAAGAKDRGDTRFEGGFAIYDAPEPWGPWTTAYFTPRWDDGPGEHADFPSKWMSPDGRTLFLVFSGDDAFSVRKATVRLTGVTPGNDALGLTLEAPWNDVQLDEPVLCRVSLKNQSDHSAFVHRKFGDEPKPRD